MLSFRSLLKFLRYWIPVALILGVIFYLSSQPPEAFPDIRFPFIDKWVHIALYTVVGFGFGRALTAGERTHLDWKRYRLLLALALILTVIWGVLDEFHQSFVPGRSVELADVVADAIGGAFGCGLTVLYRLWVIRLKFKA